MNRRITIPVLAPRRDTKAASCRGQTIVEFVLVTPMLLFLLFGVIDFSRAIGAYVTLAHSAREGARAGIYVTATDNDIRTAVRNQSSLLGNLPDSNLSISPAYPRESGDDLQVAVAYDFSAATPLFNAFWGGGTLRMIGIARKRVG